MDDLHRLLEEQRKLDEKVCLLALEMQSSVLWLTTESCQG